MKIIFKSNKTGPHCWTSSFKSGSPGLSLGKLYFTKLWSPLIPASYRAEWISSGLACAPVPWSWALSSVLPALCGTEGRLRYWGILSSVSPQNLFQPGVMSTIHAHLLALPKDAAPVIPLKLRGHTHSQALPPHTPGPVTPWVPEPSASKVSQVYLIAIPLYKQVAPLNDTVLLLDFFTLQSLREASIVVHGEHHGIPCVRVLASTWEWCELPGRGNSGARHLGASP